MAAEERDPDAQGATRKRSRTPKVPAENAIAASRKPRKAASRAQAASDTDAADRRELVPESRLSSQSKRADSDPWTVPQSVRDRFVQEGHRFYFPDGHEAFKDRGTRLTTVSENTQVVHSLVEIAESRLAGLSVRGYRPSEEERVQLIRALGRSREAASERPLPNTLDPLPAQRSPEASDARPERIRGKLLEHGRDSYRHDPNETPSYFVRLQTPEGKREFWGRDIERAIARSLSQPKVGDEVILQHTGRDAVTVKRREKDEKGEIHDRDFRAFRNRWAFETREFFEQRAVAADLVRDASVRPQDAVRQHPELAGTYLNIRAAQLVARSLRDREDQRRFADKVRLVLAAGVERGEPLEPVRLRERSRVRDDHVR